MVKRGEPPLSRRERQIMDVIYAKGQATALEVTDSLVDGPGKTAIRTLLRILEEKGHLTHEQVGQTYVYRPTHAREVAGPSALKRILEIFFGGSLEQAVAAHLSETENDLDDQELKRLIDLVQSARKSRKGDKT
ncbi:MAG TPA: BlaI/MecI/CopY family transcriptional regulator [Pirellulales bacterium]|jgi:predicted transcriptional regulator